MGVAAVIHQRDKGRLAVGHRVGQIPHPAKRAIDELCAHISLSSSTTPSLISSSADRSASVWLRRMESLALRRGGRLVLCGFCGFCGFEFEAELLARLPHQLARPRPAFTRYQQMKMLGNAERTLHGDGRAVIGDPAHEAVDAGLAKIGNNLAGKQGAATQGKFLLGHTRSLGRPLRELHCPHDRYMLE